MAVAVQDIAQWLDERGWEYLTVEVDDQTDWTDSLVAEFLKRRQ